VHCVAWLLNRSWDFFKLCCTLFMTMIWKYLDLNMKLQAICLCEVSNSSKSKRGRQYGMTFFLCNKRLVTQKQMPNSENEYLESRVFPGKIMCQTSSWTCDLGKSQPHYGILDIEHFQYSEGRLYNFKTRKSIINMHKKPSYSVAFRTGP
jgi:hypothetical protein